MRPIVRREKGKNRILKKNSATYFIDGPSKAGVFVASWDLGFYFAIPGAAN